MTLVCKDDSYLLRDGAMKNESANEVQMKMLLSGLNS